MNKIIIDMPTPELTKAVKEKVEEIFPDIPVEGYDFKCISCGEKYGDEMASDDDVAMCKWCNGTNDDEYADKGMSRGDFIDKEYTQ